MSPICLNWNPHLLISDTEKPQQEEGCYLLGRFPTGSSRPLLEAAHQMKPTFVYCRKIVGTFLRRGEETPPALLHDTPPPFPASAFVPHPPASNICRNPLPPFPLAPSPSPLPHLTVLGEDIEAAVGSSRSGRFSPPAGRPTPAAITPTKPSGLRLWLGKRQLLLLRWRRRLMLKRGGTRLADAAHLLAHPRSPPVLGPRQSPPSPPPAHIPPPTPL